MGTFHEDFMWYLRGDWENQLDPSCALGRWWMVPEIQSIAVYAMDKLSHGFLQVVAVLNGDETMYFEWGYCAEGYICIDR